MTELLAASFTSWCRLFVDALTAIAALVLALALFNGTTDILQSVLIAAVLMAAAAILEPKGTLGWSERAPRQVAHPSALSA